MDKKVGRIINLYTRLLYGEVINKANEAVRFNVNERSIQRDIDDIRAYLAENSDSDSKLVYDRVRRGYSLVKTHEEGLTNGEILIVCKILLKSRSLVKEEMYPIIEKLLRECVPYENYKKVCSLIGNEKFHYLEPYHGRKFVDTLWDAGNAVYEQRLMQIIYSKLDEIVKEKRLIQPVGIMLSENYFYLCAYDLANEETFDVLRYSSPTVYRIDRISNYEILDEHFQVPYKDRFQECEFRKKLPFKLGELRTIRFRYKGASTDEVFDKFPTAEILRHDETGWLVKIEVYGDGADYWLKSMGNLIEFE